MSNILSFVKPDPYIVICTEGRVHVIPVSVFTGIIKGDIAIQDLTQWEEICKRIIEEWLETLKGKP